MDQLNPQINTKQLSQVTEMFDITEKWRNCDLHDFLKHADCRSSSKLLNIKTYSNL